MIVNFRDGWLRDFFVDDARSRNIHTDRQSRLFRQLQMIDDARADQDLRYRRAIIRKVARQFSGFHSIRVNRQWRLIFGWDGSRGEAEGVYLDDHSYK